MKKGTLRYLVAVVQVLLKVYLERIWPLSNVIMDIKVFFRKMQTIVQLITFMLETEKYYGCNHFSVPKPIIKIYIEILLTFVTHCCPVRSLQVKSSSIYKVDQKFCRNQFHFSLQAFDLGSRHETHIENFQNTFHFKSQ